MNFTLLNSQIFFSKAGFIFFTKFYLLNEPSFRQDFADEHELLLAEFYNMADFNRAVKLDLDRFVTDSNRMQLTQIFDKILHRLKAGESIAAHALNAELLKRDNRKVIGQVVADYMVDEAQLKEHLISLQNAIANRTFYPLAPVTLAAIAGDWISTKESGQLRVNYNMTDFTPIGNQLHLRILPREDGFYSFDCFAKVVDDKHPAETQHFCVMSRLIKAEDGYIHYYRSDNMEFAYKRPVYHCTGDEFTLQIYDMEFSFKRTDPL